jgi:hypothetical protein
VAGSSVSILRLHLQASAFIMFPDIYSACRGASVLRDQTAVDAVEMFDRAALRYVRCKKFTYAFGVIAWACGNGQNSWYGDSADT